MSLLRFQALEANVLIIVLVSYHVAFSNSKTPCYHFSEVTAGHTSQIVVNVRGGSGGSV